MEHVLFERLSEFSAEYEMSHDQNHLHASAFLRMNRERDVQTTVQDKRIKQRTLNNNNMFEQLTDSQLLLHARGLDQRDMPLLALELYNMVLERDPLSLRAWNHKGLCHIRSNQLSMALFCFNKAEEIRPSWRALYGRGLLCKAQKQLHEAVVYMSNALQLYSESSDHSKEDNEEEEENDDQKDIETLKETLSQLLTDTAVALQNSGDLQLSKHKLMQALQLFPHARACFHLGYACFLQGDTRSAILHYQETLRLDHDYLAALCNLGTLLKGMGDTQGALELYRRALRVSPNVLELNKTLASCLWESAEWRRF